MSLPRLAILILVLLFLSCKSRNPVTTTRDSARIATADTSGVSDEAGYTTKYVERARLDLPDHVIALASRFAVVKGQVDSLNRYLASPGYFVHIDKKTGKADTLKAGLDIPSACLACEYFILDMTDSFHLMPLVVQVVTPAEDIYYTNSFLGYKDGKFKKLFSLEDIHQQGVQLHRVGSKLLGCISGRDEVVYNVEDDYPVEIDTKTFEVKNIIPEKQYIGWVTTATESIRAHRVDDGQGDSSLVTIKAGTKLIVDTLYRTLGKVTLRIGDSVIVEIKKGTAQKKLGHNNAG